MQRVLVCAFAFAVVIDSAAVAQIKEPGRPASERVALASEIPTFTLAAPDTETLKREDAADGYRPFRYGAVIATAIATDFAGRWDTLEDGTRVWRVRVTSAGAFTLGLVFDKWHLPEGAQLFLYDEARREVHGAYTSINNNPNDSLQIEPITGDTLIVEYVVPKSVSNDRLLQIGRVIHDYRNLRDPRIFEVAGGAGLSGCLRDVNCPEGANSQDIKRSVVMTCAGGSTCSGAILTDTTNSGTPYLLTAQHCGDMTNCVFVFNYENSTCGGNDANQLQTVSGAQLLVSDGVSDSQLYRLNTPIPASYQPYYAGWDRKVLNTVSGQLVGMGHGNGEPKQIAIDASTATTLSGYYTTNWASGILVGGNSGGPLFNASKRVIGDAHGVSNFACGSQTGFYNKLSTFWNAGLATYLDPSGSGAQTTDGYDPFGPPPPPCGSVSNNGTGCAGSCGITPTLAMTGCFAANGAVTVDLKLGNGGQQAFLFLGTSAAPTPLGCGCNLGCSGLLPIPIGPLPLSGVFCSQGAFNLGTTLPPTTVPGTIYLGAVMTDGVNACGFTTTNGLKVVFN